MTGDKSFLAVGVPSVRKVILKVWKNLLHGGPLSLKGGNSSPNSRDAQIKLIFDIFLVQINKTFSEENVKTEI